MPLKLVPRSPLPEHSYTRSPSPPPAASPTSAAGPSRSCRPPMDYLNERDMVMFGRNPLNREEAGRGLVRCQECRRAVTEWSFTEHQRICQLTKDGLSLVGKKGAANKSTKGKDDHVKRRRGSEDSQDASPLKKRLTEPSDRSINLPASAALSTSGSGAGDAADGPRKGVKLKKAELKRLKKERERLERKEMKEKEKAAVAERKRMRANGPINLDKQCGVINDKNTPCARSLTCKTHTVGAKRAVPGRSRPYDELYLDWQRQNNPNFKEPTRSGALGGPFGFAAGSGAGGLGGMSKKDKYAARRDSRMRGLGDEDDVLGGGGRVLGEVEVSEMIHCARMAGERCKLVVNLIGTAGGGVRRDGLDKKARLGPGTKGPTAGAGTTGPASNGDKDKSTDAEKALERDKWRYTLPRPTMCDSAWPGHAAFAGIGGQLVAALAARPKVIARFSRPAVPSIQAGAGAGGPGTTGGATVTLKVRPNAINPLSSANVPNVNGPPAGFGGGGNGKGMNGTAGGGGGGMMNGMGGGAGGDMGQMGMGAPNSQGMPNMGMQAMGVPGAGAGTGMGLQMQMQMQMQMQAMGMQGVQGMQGMQGVQGMMPYNGTGGMMIPGQGMGYVPPPAAAA